MKKLIYILAILASGSLYSVTNAQAKACVWCGYNVDIQPVWGPVGYSNADYYYLPDIEVYYSVTEQQFIFQQRGVWKTSPTLPVRYAAFNLYRAHKVVINEERPYLLHETNRAEYVAFKGQHDQQAIRDSQDSRYSENKNHLERNKRVVAQVNGGSQSQLKYPGHDQHKSADHNKTIAER